MPAKKFAISIPVEVMDQVDRAARARRVTRSRFIAEVLRRTAAAVGDADITRRIDAALADPAIGTEQRSTARAYRAARSDAGTEW